MYAELGLADERLSDAELLNAMLAHPILIQRPIVVTPWGVKLCRPSEAVLDILPLPQGGPFANEDGEQVIDQHGALVPARKSMSHETDLGLSALAVRRPVSSDRPVTRWRHERPSAGSGVNRISDAKDDIATARRYPMAADLAADIRRFWAAFRCARG